MNHFERIPFCTPWVKENTLTLTFWFFTWQRLWNYAWHETKNGVCEKQGHTAGWKKSWVSGNAIVGFGNTNSFCGLALAFFFLLRVELEKKEGKKTNAYSGWTHLIWNHDQRVLVFREKVKKAPEPKSIPVWQNWAAASVRLIILFCRKSPAKLIYIFLIKRSLNDLRDTEMRMLKSYWKQRDIKQCCLLSPYPGCICWGKACNPD